VNLPRVSSAVRRRPQLTFFVVLAAAIVLVPGGVLAARPPAPAPVNVQILNVSDWHGQLTPLVVGSTQVGGAAAIAAYWQADRAANPNTLTVAGGDDFGATPPVSSYFDDEPAIIAQRMMGVQVGTFGNHNFDGGIAHLQSQIDLAGAPTDVNHPGSPFTYVSANLRNVSDNLSGVDPIRYFTVGGAKIAVIGITNEEAPTLVFPGSFGTIQITDSIAAANKFAQIARNARADAVIVITHKGVRGLSPAPFGELIDLANGLDPDLVDVVIGDHTDIEYSGLVNGILVHENRSKGLTYAKTSLTVQPGQAGKAGTVTAKSVGFFTPLVSAVTPDPAISAYVASLQSALVPILGTQIAESTKPVFRADQCGQSAGRTCESLVGDIVTDAMRASFPAVDFAITNSGGLRAALTCPAGATDPNGSDLCPPALYPVPNGSSRYPITGGTVLDVLPFGNIVVTVTINGAELKTMLERGVSAMPSVDGRFAQVSGLCFTYDIASAVNSRVTGAVWANPDGTCSATPVDLTSASTYKIVENDFMAAGGDGYPNFASRAVSGDIMAQAVTNWLGANTPVAPFVLGSPNGRINCADTNGATAPNCPTLTTSP
jgi:2',3'-cyclic-nucleotide 2'-phosphodiesterase (5'-nucleotidase family)